MTKNLTFLFAPIDAIGHFNASIGLAEQLRDRGHKVVFAVPNDWKGKLSPQGFLEEWYSTSSEDEIIDGKSWGEIVTKMGNIFQLPTIERIEGFHVPICEKLMKLNKMSDPKYKEIVNKVKPDVIIVDNSLHQPALMNSGIPWILSWSMAPLAISIKNVPPAYSGYPTNGDKKEWKQFINIWNNNLKDLYSDFKDWIIQNGGPVLKYVYPLPIQYSPYANIYMCPEEMDYTCLRPNPPNFYRFDTFVRSSNETFELPEKLKNVPGKLVYFSMGTIGCCLLDMMRRVIDILGKSPHRFIVSKGPLADELDLPGNMWGLQNLPQTKVIPMVDLVISHGGNNTVTETFYFGKPLIIFPLFGDQFDNGQKIHETGLGLRFDPYKVTEMELLTAVDKLLYDDLLSKRMMTISKRIQSSNSQSRAADLIENVAKNNKLKQTHVVS